MAALYEEYETKRLALAADTINQLQAFMNKQNPTPAEMPANAGSTNPEMTEEAVANRHD